PDPGYSGSDSFTYRVTDGDGNTDDARVSITVNAVDGTSTVLHVGDLDGSSLSSGGTWDATVTAEVHDGNDALVGGATVIFSWTTQRGSTGTASCTTGDTGRCAVTVSGLAKRDGHVTFTVTNVTKTDHTYEKTKNHDPEGDSNGTQITVSKP
ncbi:MAG: cadherin-like domain-containing protein, partial [Actinomycetota bacterium]|nr:cadherin-like domain-containing protein [Actinomycetota bacterium]